jgi:hypothetical protein
VHERRYNFWTFIGFFFVIVFQNHGSKHDHGLLWVVNASKYVFYFNKIIDYFFEKYIICDSDKLTPNLCESQRYHRKKTCRKKNQVICLFEFSMAPLYGRSTNF